MELLGLFAAPGRARPRPAAAGAARRRLRSGGDGRLAVVARVAAALEARDDEAGVRLLAALEEILR